MTFLGNVLGARNAVQAENPSYPLTSEVLLQALGVDGGYTGKDVNEVTALGMSAVWRAAMIGSSVPASLPFHAYRSDGDERRKATGHGADLLNDPHPDMTPYEVKQIAFFHRKVWGNAYLRVLRDPLGRIVELWPIHPGRVRVGRESDAGRKVYVVDGNTDEPFCDAGLRDAPTGRQILHLPGMGYDGVCGVSPIRAARQSIGLGLAAEEYGARLFGSGSLATGILQTEQRLTQKQADELSARWKSKRSGLSSAHETIVVDKGATWTQLSIAPQDAQFLESRRFQIVEVCRWMGIPPFLMFETEKSTSWGTGLEQQALGWVRFDLGPDLTSVEQRFTKHVLRPAKVYAKFGLEGLLRGDSAARAAFYTAMWNIGVFDTDEIRAFEEMGPVEGGDVRHRPLNMGKLGTFDTETDDDAQPAPAPPERPARPGQDADLIPLLRGA